MTKSRSRERRWQRIWSSSRLQRIQVVHDASVINAQKLVGTRHHINVEMFSFGTLFVHEKEYRLVCESVLEDDSHDLK